MIGKRIKELRNHKNLNQKDFGNLLGVSASAISQLEKSKTVPSRQLLKSICLQFNVNHTWLETGNGPMFKESGTVYPCGPREHGEAMPDVQAYGSHTVQGITREEQDLLVKVLHVIRGKWKGKFEVSLYQNIESFYSGTMAEAGEDYTAQIKGIPPPEQLKGKREGGD